MTQYYYYNNNSKDLRILSIRAYMDGYAYIGGVLNAMIVEEALKLGFRVHCAFNEIDIFTPKCTISFAEDAISILTYPGRSHFVSYTEFEGINELLKKYDLHHE